MRVAIALVCLSVFVPVAASAAIPRFEIKAASVTTKIQLADYYKGGKVCRKVGSAVVCN